MFNNSIYYTIPNATTSCKREREVLKMPKGHYRVATGLTRIYDYANFDEYVSETIKENVETLLLGTEPLDDYISRNLTGKSSLYIRRIKKQFGPINKRLKQMKKEEEGN